MHNYGHNLNTQINLFVETKFDFRRLAQAATDKPQLTRTDGEKNTEAQITRLSSTHPFSQ